MMNFCKLCGEYKELRQSHAIGRTVFNHVLRETKNKLLLNISLRNKKIFKSGDHWKSYQLCEGCESIFNEQYENYSINGLRGKRKNIEVKQLSLGISYKNLDQEKVNLYFLSILWRASQSKHESYQIEIPKEVSDYLKYIFLNNKDLNDKIFYTRLQILYDKENILSKDVLKKIICAPYCIEKNNNLIYIFIFESWYIEIFLKKPNFNQRKKYGFLRNNKNIVLFPYIDILDIDESLIEVFSKRIREIKEKENFNL